MQIFNTIIYTVALIVNKYMNDNVSKIGQQILKSTLWEYFSFEMKTKR